MDYELIFFDADGTLFDFEKAEEAALERAFLHHSVVYSKDVHLSAYKEINSKIWMDFEQKLINMKDLKIERFRRLLSALNNGSDAEAFSQIYLEHLASGTFLIEGAEEIIRSLYGKCKIAILTNGISTVQHSRLSHSPLSNYITDIIISEEVGHPKPDKEIFEYAMKVLGHKNKATAIIVGDSLSSDIKGGYDFGIDTCYFNPHRKENKSDIQPTYEIQKLSQLLNIL